MPKPIFFLDIEQVLLHREGMAWHPNDIAPLLSELAQEHRLGILGNLPPHHDPDSFRLLLRDAGLEGWFEPELVVLANYLPRPLTDPVLFRSVAALTETPPADLTYLTAHPDRANAATTAGWQTQLPGGGVEGSLLGVEDGEVVGTLFADEVDEDTGPTFVLKGRIVTLDETDRVIDNGRLLIQRGKMAAILTPTDPLPAAFANAPVVDTQATLFPGLMDLHNHLPYNIISLWQVPKKYKNRNKWRTNPDYKKSVSAPVVALASQEATAKALVRYVEAKALLAGMTTGQGMRMIVQGVTKHFVGLMRNVEDTRDRRLPSATTRVPDLNPRRPSDLEGARRNLDRSTAWFYHLAEGVDEESRLHFKTLLDNNLLGKALVGIHSLGLQRADLDAVAAAGGKVVWSPLSNLLLYGKTIKLADLLGSGVLFSLGCDWSPSGSKNPLLELKVARWVAQKQNAPITSRQLVGLLTDKAAQVVGWQKHLGSLKPGMLADIIAVNGTDGDPYDKLIDARERDISLVIIHGMPRVGNEATLRQLLPATAVLETLTIDSAPKSFFWQHPLSTLNDLPLKAAQQRLSDAMGDLKGFIRNGQTNGGLLDFGSSGDPFGLVLDMESHDTDHPSGLLTASLFDVSEEQVPDSVPLDTLEVADPVFWATMLAEQNLPANLAADLQQFYT